jgi:Nif-specific regulatory protein
MEPDSGRTIEQRYAIIRPLGEGGTGEVYLARDTHQGGKQVALKLLRPDALDAPTVELFKDEFRSMARLRHPNLAEVYDFGTSAEDGRHFLTMEYIEGRNLAALPPAEIAERFDDLAVQCLRALDYIHSRGLLHNDIKPQNILVRPQLQLKVLDFGLAHGESGPARPGPAGTVHYISPERFRSDRIDARSDLYSLGVVFYELLTGALPHQGADAGKVVQAILRGPLRPPRELNPAIPERIEAFVMALLARDPGSRPASASAALDLLNAGSPDPRRLDTPETHASFVTTGRFVGRDAELSDLLALATAHAGGPAADPDAPRLALVTGPSGIGKSRLLRELKHRLQLAGLRSLTGRCYEDGGVPFQPFVEVLRQLGPDRGDLPAGTRIVLDRLLPAAAEQAPAGAPPPRAAPGALSKSEFISGVARSLDHFGKDAPGVLFLEDLHWGDAAGLELLEHLVLRPGHGPWLVIGSLRDDESASRPAGAFVKRFSASPRVRTLALDPLGPGEVADLLSSMVPFEVRPDRLAGLLADRTEGNPLYVEELMESLAEAGTLRRRGGAWIAEDPALDSIQLPPSLLSAVTRRLASIAPADRSVAEALAVVNRPAPVALLAQILGRDAAIVTASLEALDRLRIAVSETQRSGPPLAGLFHGRIREAIYENLEEDSRRGLHLAVASAIESAARESLRGGSIDAVVEELAHHFSAAGDRERGAGYCLRAGAKAATLFNPRREIEFLTRALDLLPADDWGRRLPALADIAGDLAQHLGDFGGALRHARILQEEARKAGDAVHEAKALEMQGWAKSFSGDPAGALEAARRALAIARGAGDPKRIAVCLNTLGMILARQGRNREAGPLFDEARSICEAQGDLRFLIAVLSNSALNALGQGEPEIARQSLERILALSKENGWSDSYHRALGNLAIARQETGDLPGGVQALEETLAWAREHANQEIMGQVLSNLGLFHGQLGRFDQALRALEEERALRRDLGDLAGQLPSIDFLGNLHRDLGQLDRAEAAHREGLEAARRLNLKVQEGHLLCGLAADRLEGGALDDAGVLARDALAIGRELERPRIVCHALCVQVLAAAGSRDRKALAAVMRSVTRLDPRTLRCHDRLRLNLVVGRSALLCGKPEGAIREARAGLAAAEGGGFREFQWRFHALLGDAQAAKGLRDAAHDSYNSARAIIRQVACEIEDRSVRDDYLKEEKRRALGAPESQAASASPVTPASPAAPPAAGAASSAGAPAASPSGTPVRMLTTIYQITQIINSILDLKELLNKVMDLAIEIVGAERGLIFLYRSETDEMEMVVARNMERQTIKDATEYSRSVLKEAGRGLSILSIDAAADDRFRQFRSVTMFHIRSLLCVPLKIKNRIIGTVYVDTRKPGVVFTEDEQRFLEAFANQAAIAIENARLYDQVRQENTYLKAAVQERYGYENIIGRSAKMREVFVLLSRVAASSLPVVIRGESGTGKELVARAIHHNSARRDRRFFTENCAALPDTLLESELFGHVKGAFTGADSTRKGLFELADGGTLLLDEVGDMSLPLQSKLLRVLQDGEMRPVGSETARHVDVRVISATNRDLEAMIKQKTFREDLYFRLNVVNVRIPPLRERREDIPLLVDHFLGKIAAENKTAKLRVDAALMGRLTRHDWPGNVRELENQIYRLALFARGDALTLEDASHDSEFITKIGDADRAGSPGDRGVERGITSEDIRRALSEANGNRDEAARLLGISRATMFRKLKQFKITETRPRPARRPHPA